MIDDIYKNVQAILNKDQLGYLKPMWYNAFIRQAVRKVYNDMFTDFKSNVRKQNWMLDGRNMAHYAELLNQMIEYYGVEEPNLTTPYVLPDDLEYINSVFHKNKEVDKIDYEDHKRLIGNIYANPSNCAPVFSKLGDRLKISPSDLGNVELHYTRRPKVPKWTFEEVDSKPMFDDTKPDFQDIDMPHKFYDELTSIVTEKASVMLRDQLPIQTENTDQQQETAEDNRQ